MVEIHNFYQCFEWHGVARNPGDTTPPSVRVLVFVQTGRGVAQIKKVPIAMSLERRAHSSEESQRRRKPRLCCQDATSSASSSFKQLSQTASPEFDASVAMTLAEHRLKEHLCIQRPWERETDGSGRTPRLATKCTKSTST